MRNLIATLAAILAAGAQAQTVAPVDVDRGPVLDMHIHAYGASPPTNRVCVPFPGFVPLDPGKGGTGLPAYLKRMFDEQPCRIGLESATSDDDLRRRTIAALRRNDVYAVAGGSPAYVDRWLADEPRRLLPAIGANHPDKLPSPDELRRRHAAGRLTALSELSFQYNGITRDDPRLEPYWALAEELDVPVGIHMGPGAPGTAYFATPGYRVALTDPLLLEPILIRHPKLRVFVIHAGYPMKERMLALMEAHPQVYAEFGFLTAGYRDDAVWPYIQAFVDAGFEDRILYGTDQMEWPDLVDVEVRRVRETPRLSAAVKRKFLYRNAARFLRIDPAGVLRK